MGVIGTPSGTTTNDTGTALTATWLGALTNTTDSLTTYNMGSVTAGSSGLLVVLYCIVGAGAVTISSATIGGASATFWHNYANTSHKIAIFGLSVSAGSQAVSVTLSGSNSTLTGAAAGCWLLTGYRSAAPVCTSVLNVNTVTSNAFTLNTTPIGVWLGMSMHENNNATNWSAGTAEYDANVNNAGGGSGNRRWSFVDGTNSTGNPSTMTVTASWTGSVNSDYAGAMFA